ncbi:MAG: hypothetical protein M1827_002752 [Pycnora praestabilis]|nr:MAG: hypothetical protein M1827_002752 [Pycnora praestabilis]
MADGREPDRQSVTSISSEIDGHARSPSTSSIPTDVFGDEFALEPFEVSHGFSNGLNGGRYQPSSPEPDSPSGSSTPPIITTSIAEPTYDREADSKGSGLPTSPGILPFQRDTSAGQTHLRTNGTPSLSTHNRTPRPQRTLSMASESTVGVTRVESPYQGVTGPSHPYAMYPQGIGLSRTPSIATTASILMPHRLSHVNVNGPAHPYGMYPQNTVDEVEAPLNDSPPIPVGFPGLGQSYRRRLGPEGEEAEDIIGPDGHTEQLPPYSKYPDGIIPKDHPQEVCAATELPTAAQTPGLSQNSLVSPQSRLSTRSEVSHSSNTQLNNVEAGEADPSGHCKERFVEQGQRRYCGGKMPLWLIVILVLLAFGVILGGAIGGILSRKQGHHHVHHPDPARASPTTVTATVVSTIDASAIPTPPPNLPALPSGTFAVSPGTPQSSSNTCLTNSAQSNAWSCDIAAGPLDIQVTPLQNNGQTVFQFSSSQPAGAQIKYGSQPPAIGLQRLVMVLDTDEPSRGPAYFFQIQYDKIVVVNPTDFAAGDLLPRAFEEGLELTERDNSLNGSDTDTSDWSRHQVANPGDKPWYCYWNNTILEGFFYVTQNSSQNSSSSASSTTSSASSGGSYTSTSMPISMTTPPTSSYYGPPSKRQSNPSSSIFPKVIKLEERRVVGTSDYITPYCQQMQVLDDGNVGVVPGPNGTPVIVTLNETEPASQAEAESTGSSSSRLRQRSWAGYFVRRENVRRQYNGNACGCEWLIQ